MLHDTLPHRDHDPVLTLYAHYFLAAELMRTNYAKLSTQRKQRGRLSRKGDVNLSIYFCSWLGFLAVTCEGFKKLQVRLLLQKNRPEDFCELVPKSDGIGRTIKQHFDPLREFRNSVFHLRDDTGSINRFFTQKVGRLLWAEKLHADFVDFFSDYRVLCEVHYVLKDRTSEIRM